jgi:hypothetical protein
VVPVSPEQQQIDSLISLLQDMANGSTPHFPVLSYEDATDQAGNELNPEYDQAKKELLRLTDIDLEKRGIYNAPLASGIVTEKVGGFEAGRQSAIGQRANELVQQSQQNAVQQQQLYLQDRSQRMDTLASLLSTLSGRQLTRAELTGTLDGIRTIAAQQLDSDNAYRQAITTGYNADGTPTLERETSENNLKLQIAQLTGYYNGSATLERDKFDLQKYQTDMDSAIARLNALGRVTTQDDAVMLGVPVGTSSWQAANAVAERKARMEELKSSSSTLNQDLLMWELTGVAPDSQNLKNYGVAPGTPWQGTSEDKLKKIENDAALAEVEETEKFDAAVESYKKLYSTNDATAEEIAAIYELEFRADALRIVNQNEAALKTKGVDMTKLRRAINIRFPDLENGSYLRASTEEMNGLGGIGNSTLTMDQLTSYSNEVRRWFEQAVQNANNGDERAAQLLFQFDQRFPNGAGSIADKLGFVRANLPFQTSFKNKK